MVTRRIWTMVASLLLAATVGPGELLRAQEYEAYPLEARIWLDRGEEPLLRRGERVRIYYRVSEDAYVAIFHIDTDGMARMVFPNSPQENHFARGGRDYRALFPGSSYWFVDDYPGMGYYFIVASPVPFDFTDFRYSHYDGGWDLNFVGRQVYQDPYLAMDDYVASLIPDWEYVSYGLDFTAYHVEERHDYPRFLCYDCHGFRPYYSWNPYRYSCSTFRVVIYNDPYYYPSTRYLGNRVVYVAPRRGVPHFAFKERAAGEPGTPQVVVRTGGRVAQPGVEGTTNRRGVPQISVPGDRGAAGSTGAAARGSDRTGAGVRGAVTRRGGDGATGGDGTRTTRPSQNLRGRTGGATTVVPPRTDRTGGATTTIPPRSTIRPTLEKRQPKATTPATSRSGSRVVRPSSRTSGTARSRGTTSRSSGTVQRGGASSRSSGTVRRGGTSSRTSGAVKRSSGGSSRSTPPVARSSGGASRSSSARSGSATRSPPKVRSGTSRSGSSGSSRARTPPTRKKRGGGV